MSDAADHPPSGHQVQHSPGAGWWPDPGGGWRWFDGQQWSAIVWQPDAAASGRKVAGSGGQRRVRVDPPVASAGATWVGLAGAVALSVLSVIPVLVWALATGRIDTGQLEGGESALSDVLETVLVPVSVAGSVALWLGFVVAYLWACRVSHLGWRDGLGLTRVGRDVAIGVAVGVALRWPLVPLEAALGRGGDPQGVAAVLDAASGWWLVALVATVCVGAPVFEELFFRGVMLPSLSRPLPTWAAIAISTLVFAALHLGQQPLAAVALVCLAGAVFGLVRVRTRSLVAPIVAHAVFNATSMALALAWG